MKKSPNEPKKQSEPAKKQFPSSNPNVGFPTRKEDEVTDPPVPNRAWTQMKLGCDIDALTEEEKADLYLGPDSFF